MNMKLKQYIFIIFCAASQTIRSFDWGAMSGPPSMPEPSAPTSEQPLAQQQGVALSHLPKLAPEKKITVTQAPTQPKSTLQAQPVVKTETPGIVGPAPQEGPSGPAVAHYVPPVAKPTKQAQPTFSFDMNAIPAAASSFYEMCVATDPACKNVPNAGQIINEQSCSNLGAAWENLQSSGVTMATLDQCTQCLNACNQRYTAHQAALSQQRQDALGKFKSCTIDQHVDADKGSICCGGYIQSADAENKREAQLQSAVLAGDYQTVIELLNAGVSPNIFTDQVNQESIIWTAINAYSPGSNFQKTVNTLLAFGGNPNTATKANYTKAPAEFSNTPVTPLMLAASQGKIEAVKVLVPGNGLALLSALDPESSNQAVLAYQSALKNGHTDIAQYLLTTLPSESLQK